MTDKEAAKLVYDFVKKIPRGKVATYGDIQKACGLENARQVGKVLHSNPDPKNIPCYRVVRYDGTLSEMYMFGGAQAQRARLEADGVGFLKDKVVMWKYRLTSR